MIDTNSEKARKIIENNIYITIATASKDGLPWISPVYSAHDKDYTFYWISPMDTLHSRLIRENHRVAIVIFDSRAPEGTGEGVYIKDKGL